MKKTLLLLGFLTALLLPLAAEEEVMEPGIYAQIETTAGIMVFKLDYENTPLTVINFMALSQGLLEAEDRSGAYYDGLPFYKIVKNYAVFTGDTMGNGTGSPGYTFPRETPGNCSAAEPGTLVMGGLLGQSHGSHFFIMTGSDAYLDTKYTPFGSLISGANVLNKITEKDSIKSVTFSREGEEAESFKVSKEKFSSLKSAQLKKNMVILKKENPLLAAAIEKLGPDYQRSSAGTYYSISKQGTGKKPVSGQTIKVHYIGSLLDGTQFDNSRARGQSFELVIGEQQVIPGWTEVLMDMKAGEIRTAIIPPAMAYGNMSVGPIPPNSWLVFEIEVLNIK